MLRAGGRERAVLCPKQRIAPGCHKKTAAHVTSIAKHQTLVYLTRRATCAPS